MNLRACFTLVLLTAAVAYPRAEIAPLTLPEVFAELRQHHPALAAARARTEAARARIDQERAWMDPRLAVEQMRDNTRLADYAELKVTLTQEIPLSGRNTLRARSAEAESAVVASEALRREWMLLNDARTTFVRLAAADERLAVNRRARELLTQTAALTRLAYETGRAAQADVLATETELARLDGERTELVSTRTQEAARLNTLLLRPASTPVGPLALPESTPPALGLEAAVARARAASPEIAVALRETEVASARLALARKNRSVDPELMLAARHMSGMGGDAVTSYDTGVAFSLPWFNPGRNRSELTEARARLAASQADRQALEAEVAGMAASAHARAVAAHEQFVRQRDQLVPLARAATDAARRDYEAGRGPLLSVLAAERLKLEAEQGLADTRADQAISHAEYTFLTSQDLAP